jgi:hypothetical protein
MPLVIKSIFTRDLIEMKAHGEKNMISGLYFLISWKVGICTLAASLILCSHDDNFIRLKGDRPGFRHFSLQKLQIKDSHQ